MKSRSHEYSDVHACVKSVHCPRARCYALIDSSCHNHAAAERDR